jgi:hypothetical protein
MTVHIIILIVRLGLCMIRGVAAHTPALIADPGDEVHLVVVVLGETAQRIRAADPAPQVSRPAGQPWAWACPRARDWSRTRLNGRLQYASTASQQEHGAAVRLHLPASLVAPRQLSSRATLPPLLQGLDGGKRHRRRPQSRAACPRGVRHTPRLWTRQVSIRLELQAALRERSSRFHARSLSTRGAVIGAPLNVLLAKLFYLPPTRSTRSG